MALAPANITHGPAAFQLAATEIGHTQGGITCTITPANRARNVDQYGSSELAIIHTGDQVRMTVTFAQWDAATLAEVYEPGNDQTAAVGAKYLGVGRSAGYIYTTKAALIIPRLSADAAKRISMLKATPVGELSLEHLAENDRLLETEFACLADPTATDGELIGKMELTSS